MSTCLHSPYKRSHKSPVTEAEEGLSLVSFCSKTSPFLTVALVGNKKFTQIFFLNTEIEWNVDFKLKSRKKNTGVTNPDHALNRKGVKNPVILRILSFNRSLRKYHGKSLATMIAPPNSQGFSDFGT